MKEQMKRGMNQVKGWIPYLLAVVLCIGAALPAASESVVWDEAFSAVLARESVTGVIKGTAMDVHPPLYYLLLKLSAVFGGESVFKYRLVTAMGTWCNLLILGATMIRRRWGNRVSVLYLLWFGLAYSTVEKSSLLRMYTWGAFFVTAASLCLYFYYEAAQSPERKPQKYRNLTAAVLFSLAAMYTHYYAVMAVFAAWVLLLIVMIGKKRQEWKRICGCGILIGIGYLPWMGVVLTQSRQVSEHYWIEAFDWKEWASAPALLMETSMEGMQWAIYGLLLFLFVMACCKKQKTAMAAAGVFIGTMIIGALLSILVAPIWTSRYLYVAFGMAALMAALQWERTPAYAEM